MNYVLGLLLTMVLIACLMTYVLPTLVAVAVGSGWWMWYARDRDHSHHHHYNHHREWG